MTQASTIERPAEKTAQASSDRRARRKQLFAILAAVIAVIAVLWLLYWLLIGSRHVSTDDAYVQADTAQVTALVAGPLISVPVGETQHVKKGEVVAVIDPADYRLALSRAQAQLGQAERKVRGYFANVEAASAQTDARSSDLARAEAQLASAQSDLVRAQTEYDRRHALAGTGAVSADELTEVQNQRQTTAAAVSAAQAALKQAKANISVAGAQRDAAAVLVQGADVATNPEVAEAVAQRNQAQLDLDRTVIRAPVDGIVAKKAIEIGQRVAAGTELMTIVPVQSAYVDANFKEVQLRKIRVGSPVVLTSDLYGGRVKFHGKVIGVAGGSGSAFALIPAQNATGNWIKVVQRVPVRIALDPQELEKHPLRVGLSMKAEVEVR
ncbi:MAG TPA: HlyD family secretion protein [Phenylobacterium sp.]|uniref:HlyD family secretion protein n=1 Tax=Phenylobacterium sp. TaxID=1871053 RepID=UPI002B47625F|nr:HlyD family secretion protein [Phenylobacterium sp.]HKR90471.1 HlyD family secretion protein [Phenylobacterium sp.]